MTRCALMVDVIVGELSLLESGITERARNPLCPVIGIQISRGPLVYIPFLTPESIKSHLQYISDGHQFLPLEVEESYLSGGKFTFKRGKSCLYSVPHESVISDIDNNGSVADSRVSMFSLQSVTITVINALVFPPAFFGKCNTKLSADNEVEGSMAGKVQLSNHNGKLVGHLTIAITLKNLGEEVALHTKNHSDDTSQDSYTKVLHDIFIPHRKDQIVKKTDERAINCEDSKDGDLTDHRTNFHSNQGSVNKNGTRKGLEQSYVCSGIPFDDYFHDGESRCESSEEIASRIAELVSYEDTREAVNSMRNVKSNEEMLQKFAQPSPIMYYGHDSEFESLWNQKMQNFGGFTEITNNSVIHSEDRDKTSGMQEDSLSYSNDESFLSSTSQIVSEHMNESSSGNLLSEESVLTSNTDHRKNDKSKRWKLLKNPKGWLRSTPVASCAMSNKKVYPRLTRTALLRRARLDPQLAHQLNTEVNHQVKQRLHLLERNFKEDLFDIRKKKQLKSKCSKSTSVGCQAGSDLNERLSQNDRKLQKDFTQQTFLLQTTHQATQVSRSVPKENDVTLADSTVKSLSRLEKNQTFDIDVAKYRHNDVQNRTFDIDFTENKPNFQNRTFDVDITEYTQNDMPNYDDDFEVSTTGHSDAESVSEVLVKRKSRDYSLATSHSQMSVSKGTHSHHPLSVSRSEPKTQNKGRSATNRTRDIKMKVSSSDSKAVSSASYSEKIKSKQKYSKSSKHRDYLDDERPTSTSDDSFKSAKSTEGRIIKMQYSSSHRSISETDHPSEILSSDASEISEASDLSKEIYQEIMRGRKADVLLRNGSQVRDMANESSIAEESVMRSSSSSPLPQNAKPIAKSEMTGSMKSKFIKAGETFSIGEIIHSDHEKDYSLKEYGETSSETSSKSETKRRNLYKGTKNRELYKTYTKSEASLEYLLQRTDIENKPRNINTASAVSSPKEVDDVESSVSNISARIAALLIPKKLHVASLHTDSISSYMPSNVSDTMSSLSDME